MNKEVIIFHFAQNITGKSDGVFNHLLMIFKNVNENVKNIIYFDGGEEAVKKLNHLKIEYYLSKDINKKIPIRFIFNAIKLIRKYNPDIIQSHSTKCYITIGLLNIFFRKKHIFNYHGTFIFNIYYNLIEKIILYIFHLIIFYFKGCSKVIAPSKNNIEELKRESQLFSSFSYYYNTAIDDTETEIDENIDKIILSKKQSHFLIGMITRNEKTKRVDISLSVLKYLLDKSYENIYMFIFGDGPLLGDMKAFAKILKVYNNVKFLNYVPNTKYYLKHFDLVLYTSLSEGLPLSIWESMKQGVPIVSSDVGGIREIIEQENCGYVYPFGDIEKCAKLIMDLYNNPGKAKKLGNNGKNALEKKYSKRIFINFFKQLYFELTSEKKN